MWTVIFKYFISVECSANRYLHGIYTTKTTKAVTDFGCRNVDVVSRGLWITTVGWNLYEFISSEMREPLFVFYTDFSCTSALSSRHCNDNCVD